MIPLMKNAFSNEYETKKALADFIMSAQRLSMDIECLKFERKFSEYQGRKDSVLFNSGGSANLAMLQALRNMGLLNAGDGVGFSALTWSTNTMPIIQMGLVPVPIDCELENLNVVSHKILDRLRDVPLKALFITNVLGLTGDLNVIKDLCSERNIILLEDNCESLGTELPEGRAGNFGMGASFSFFVAHHMSTIEGGMVSTDDQEFAEMLRIVRANGWDRNLKPSQQNRLRKKYNVVSEFDAKYTFYDLGFNLRPTEITGFLGQIQMEYLEKNIALREKNYLYIESLVHKNKDFIPLDRSHLTKISSFALPFVCTSPALRAEYLSKFAGAGIEVRPMIAGNMQRQPFYKKYVQKTFALESTDHIHNCGFYCGNYPELSEIDLNVIATCVMHS